MSLNLVVHGQLDVYNSATQVERGYYSSSKYDTIKEDID